MPRSVTTPVRWVVRTTEPDRRVTRLFCMPMHQDSAPADGACDMASIESTAPWTSSAVP
jgi:hypothetical protein